jgi:EAL domain-containing protein (putative c-di-GMP-specific phosphodiesterase class I)
MSKEPVFFEKEFREEKFREQQVIGAFYGALYRDDFRMYLQPKFRLGNHEVYGAEALARWQLTDGTIMPPEEFLEPLEHIGYVRELDFYIFEEVLKAMTRWQTGNRKQIVVSTNFSGVHFENDVEHFLERIRLLISKYSISPTFIEIEVTESAMVHNMQNLKYGMDRLHEMGFRIAIDDFGTGYSSLSVLMDIPADVVKMDKSFIDNGIEGRRRDLITEIGKLVRIAGKEIIFEGIETEEQEQLLMECGFHNGQGYLCNRPIMVPEFERLYF